MQPLPGLLAWQSSSGASSAGAGGSEGAEEDEGIALH